ncbi:MAG: T9SS type A sorting domain-containing protein, partial [Bacteroidia bacterium]
ISPLSAELQRLQDDLEGDGWDVIRHNVDRAGTVTHVRSLVMADYALDPVNTKAIFIVGHVPVPYSGNINPDGHPDHLGAWPTDTYYADVNGTWTDATITTTNVVPARTQNVPGDGKFDQSVIPTDLELQAGRADFSNLPSFSSSEQALLKNYLDKDHNYRKKVFATIRQGVLDDNFGYFSGEAFAASGFMNMGPLVGPSTVAQADYFTSMSSASYLWSYGCGGGSYTSSSGIGATSNFVSSSLNGVFTMLFGSYFGDWDSQDNFLRAPLAQGNILTSVWSGRPYYHFHHMGMGQNIGYSIMLTQNNLGSLYFSPSTGITGRWVHNALMGDPTLRNDVVAPVSNVVATKTGNNCQITWSASTETAVIGYNIYMKNDTNTAYVKINAAPIVGTSYTDLCLQYKGIYKYMVRTLILQTNPSGTYYNMSEGIADTAMNTSGMKVYAAFTPAVSGNTVTFTNGSANATGYTWNFGDLGTSTSTSPTHVYAGGTYTVMLIANNSCASDTIYYSPLVISTVGVAGLSANGKALSVYPNPCSGKLFVSADKNSGAMEARVYNSEGRQVYYSEDVTRETEINLSDCRQGLYLLQVTDKSNKSYVTKFVVE